MMIAPFPFRRGAILALALLVPAIASAVDRQPTPAELARTAENQFVAGLAQLEDDPSTAESALKKAATMYELLAAHPGTRTAAARRNAANAWLLAGDIGRALLNYRRTLALRPGDRPARSGLARARSAVSALAPASTLPRLRDRLAIEFRGWLWTVILAANAAFWIAAVRILTSPSSRVRALAAASAVTLLASVVLLVWSNGSRPGAITAPEVIGRQGNGSVYEPAWRSPLPNGVEFHLLEERDRWWKIQLADGTTGWIPAEAAQLVESAS